MSARPSALGKPRLHVRQIDSTNIRARELAAAGAPHGTLVTAAEQLAGRGRQGRHWTTPPGTAIAMSLVIRDTSQLLSLAAGVAVAATVDCVSKKSTHSGQIRHAPAESAQIKWPNDVLVAGRKVAGILVEGRPLERWAVLGIGINVSIPQDEFPPELRDRAGTLGLPTTAIEPTLQTLLEQLSRWLYSADDAILDAVRARDALLGQPVSWAGGSGIGAGIDSAGRLLVDLDGQRTALDAGEVHLSRAD